MPAEYCQWPIFGSYRQIYCISADNTHSGQNADIRNFQRCASADISADNRQIQESVALWTSLDTRYNLSFEWTDLERGLEHHVHDAVALVEVGHRVRVALLLLDDSRQRRQEVHEEGAVQVLAQLWAGMIN